MSHDPLLSLVLPVYRLRALLPVVVRALEAQTLPFRDFECIFVDDGSGDGSAEWLEALETPLRLRVLRNPRNLGRSPTRNRGIREARGAWVLFLDGDMIASPHLLERYAARMRRGDSDVVSGRRVHLDLSAQPGTLANRLAAIIDPGLREDEVLVSDPQSHWTALRALARIGQKPGPVQEGIELELQPLCERFPRSLLRAVAFVTSNVAVRRELLLETELFVTHLSHGEDTELGLQLAERGARYAYAEEAEALHPFWEREDAPPNVERNFDILIRRHPLKQLPLMFLWARYHTPELPPPRDPRLASLLELARLEAAGDLAELDIEAAIRDGGTLPIRAKFDLALERALDERAPVEPDRGRLRDALQQAAARGFLSAHRDGTLWFDRFLLADWLNRHGPWLGRGWTANVLHRRPTPRMVDRDAPSLRATWTGTYTVEVPEAALAAGEPLAVVLSVPAQTRAQPRVTVEELPAGSRALADRVVLAPLAAGAGRALGYRFTCVVEEARPPGEPDPEAAAWLQPTFPVEALARLRRVLARLPERADAEDRVRDIYDWMVSDVRYCLSPLPDHAIAETGAGACIHHARLFVNLCRLSGLPARERCGALLHRSGPGETVAAGDTGNPFAHTWAEVHVPRRGWIPIEFLALAHGRSMLTPWNLGDARDRARYVAEGEKLAAYCLGGVDPYRIWASSSANRVTPLMARRRGRWAPVSAPELQPRHHLTARAVSLELSA